MPGYMCHVAIPSNTTTSFTEYMGVPYRSCIETISVALDNPFTIERAVMDIDRTFQEMNIQVRSFVLGFVEFISLRNHYEARGWLVSTNDGNDGEFVVNEITFIMDPLRDRGPRIPLFDFNEGLKVLSARRRAGH